MNQSELEQNYLELQEALSIILETAAQKNYRLNYPTIDFQAMPEINYSVGLKERLEGLEPYLRNRALITAPPSAPPEDLLGVTYFAYKMGYLDRPLAEAVTASKMAYIPDLMKLQINETMICEASLLEVAAACYTQRQNEPMYQKNFTDSCQRFIQTQACIQAKSQMKSSSIPFYEIPFAFEEENIVVRVDHLAVIDHKIGGDDCKNTQASLPLWSDRMLQKETFTIEFSSAVLQQLNHLLPEHKKTWMIHSDYHCVNLQSYLRACLAKQIVIKENDYRWHQKFNTAKSKYVFNLVNVADKITAAQRAKYSYVSAEKKYSIIDLKADLNKCYQEFKQACLYHQECDLSGAALVNHFCEKVRATPSLVQTDELILFLDQIKQLSFTYDLQTIHLYLVNNQPYLYGKKTSTPTTTQGESAYSVNPEAETARAEIDLILPAIPEDDEIDKKKRSKFIQDSGQGLLCQQVAGPSSKRANKMNTCSLSLEKKVIDHLTSNYYKAQYTEKITRLDEKFSHAVAKFNTNLQVAVDEKKYSESHLRELEEEFDQIKSYLNSQHELVKKRAHLVFPTYAERFQVASQRTKMSPYHRDLLETAFIKTERFLDNVEIIACHLARATEIACAVIWEAQQVGYINKDLAHLLLSIRHEHLPDRYKYRVDKTGVIRQASVLESAEWAYKALSVSEVESVKEQFNRSDAYFKHLACHQYDPDLLALENRLHHLHMESFSSEEGAAKVLHRDEELGKAVSCSYPEQEMSGNNFIRFNEIEVEFFNQLLQESEKRVHAQLRYDWQINLEKLMHRVCSISEENESILSDAEDEDIEDRCYSKVTKIICCAKNSLDHAFRGESILFGSYINHNDPDSIQRGLNEAITSYEEKVKKTVKCNLYGAELIDQFIVVSNKKIYAQYLQAEKQQKESYKKEKSLLRFTAFSEKRKLKNKNKSELKRLQSEYQVKGACILKIGNAAKKQGAENILLYLNPSLTRSVTGSQEESITEASGYFLRQQEISLREGSSKKIKKEFNFDINTLREGKRKFSETRRDRLSSCSFWEASIAASEKDNHLIEKSFQKHILNISFSKSACLSK